MKGLFIHTVTGGGKLRKIIIIKLLFFKFLFSLEIGPLKNISSPEKEILKNLIEKPFKEEFLKDGKNLRWILFDIKKFCNRSHIDKTGNEWINQKDVDLKYLKTGNVSFYGIPFYIINPEENNGKSCIILGSDKFTEFPKEVTIPVNKKLNYIFFLHACAFASWGDGREYRILYEDGNSISIPVIAIGASAFGQNENIQDWFFSSVLKNPNVREIPVPMVENPVGLSDLKYIYILMWENPNYEKLIKELKLISGRGTTTLFIFAITGGEK